MRDAAPLYDYFGYHQHGTFQRLYNEIEHRIIPMRERLSSSDKPFYFNETGLAREFEREDEMASSLIKKLTYVWSRGAAGYHWFCMWVPDSRKSSSAYGYRMFNEDFSPRPAFVAYNTAARYLRGREYVGELDLGEGRFGLLFRGAGDFTGTSDRDYVAVVWTQRQDLAPAVLAMDAAGAREIQTVSVMGDQKPAATLGNKALATIGHEPSFLLFHGTSSYAPGLSTPLITPPGAIALAPGKTASAQATLHKQRCTTRARSGLLSTSSGSATVRSRSSAMPPTPSHCHPASLRQ
ncbi:MAG: hypothetical protein AAF823_01490 [Planctomycetota bacterium]